MEGFGKKIKDIGFYAAFAGMVGATGTISTITAKMLKEDYDRSHRDPSEYGWFANNNPERDRILEQGEIYNEDIEIVKGHPELITDGSADTLNLQKDWVIQKLKDPAYLARAMVYEKLTPEEVKERALLAENTPIFYFNNENLQSVLGEKDSLVRGANLSYTKDKGFIAISANDKSFKKGNPTVVHEVAHSATRGDRAMSDYATDLYQKAFLSPEDSIVNSPDLKYTNEFLGSNYSVDKITPEDKKFFAWSARYLSDPTELDARKKVFEYELEKKGIKKYGEPFTDEVLKQVLSAYKKKLFSRNSSEFLDHIKPEYLKLIMNTIADAGNGRAPDNLPVENNS